MFVPTTLQTMWSRCLNHVFFLSAKKNEENWNIIAWLSFLFDCIFSSDTHKRGKYFKCHRVKFSFYFFFVFFFCDEFSRIVRRTPVYQICPMNQQAKKKKNNSPKTNIWCVDTPLVHKQRRYPSIETALKGVAY